MSLELRGDIPGLLRFTSPVVVLKWKPGYVVLYVSPLVVAARKGVTDIIDEVDGCDVVLDLSDRTGRFHAREYLLEHGHPTEEDRAEALAWSVLSVYRGGRPLRVAPQWNYNARYLEGGYWIARVRDHGWSVGDERGEETGDAGKAAADAALLRLGWALTNADGTLTLPPLPGAA